MGRARKSALNGRVRKPLAAPTTLPPRERALWVQIVKGQSAGWFVHGAEALLEAHVRCVVFLEQMHKRRDLMLANPDNGIADLAELNEVIEKQTRLLAMTARSLRLTQQSRVRENIPKDQPGMPWEDGFDTDEDVTA